MIIGAIVVVRPAAQVIPAGPGLIAGPPGKSAFDAARDEGFTGTELEWLASLVGPPGGAGEKGDKGDKGDPGAKGDQGAAGPQAWQTPPSAWAASTVYSAAAPASTVTYAGESYVCSTSHSSTSTFDASKWTKLAAKGADGSAATALTAPQGRLTLSSGVPVLSSAVSAATSVLYTPYAGNLIPLWNGSADVMTPFAEVSQALSDTSKSPSAAAAANIYDLFAWSDAGTIRVTRGPAWSAGTGGSNAARGTGAGSTALTRVNGLLRNANAITNGPAAGYGTYVGTIMTDSVGATVSFNTGGSGAGGVAAVVGLWNAFNRVSVGGTVKDTTASWTYAVAGWRAANQSGSIRVTFVQGLAEDCWGAAYNAHIGSGGNFGDCGVGLNSTSGAISTTGYVGNAISVMSRAEFRGPVPLGQNFLTALEFASGVTVTYFGAGATGLQSGLVWDGRY